MPFTGSLKTHQLTTDDSYHRWLKFLLNTAQINEFYKLSAITSKLEWTTDPSNFKKIKTFMNATTNPDRLNELDFNKDIAAILVEYDRILSNFYASLKDIFREEI
jgi:hypothetical protein